MPEDLPTAIALHRAGRLAEAEEIYRAILQSDPANADALQLLGLIACQHNDLPRAVELISRAVAITPANAEFHINLAEVQRRMNRLGDAEASLRRAAELAPDNAFVWYNLGVVLRTLKATEAADAFQRAIALQPGLAEAHNNLGLLRQQSGDFPAAADSFRRALELRPNHAETENNLGMALWKSRQEHEAIATFKHAIRSRPDFAAAHLNLGTALRKLGRRAEALATLRHAADLDARSPEIQRELGRALLETGRVEDAAEACRRGTELAPDDADAWHALGVALAAKAARDPTGNSAAGGEAIAAYQRALELKPHMLEWAFELAPLRGHTPAAPPDAFVRNLFDEYALRFEQHLVRELHYCVPQNLLAEILRISSTPDENPGLPREPAMDASLPGHHAKWDILDLGCGTGLCGALFRPHARHITGIDLSPNMIEASRRRGGGGGGKIYDDLFCGTLLDGLRPHENRFDLILAADVFIYVGALDQLLPATARALKPGGRLAFSLENHDGDGFTLHHQHRYAHSIEYVRQITREAGLTEISATPSPLRDDVPIGWIVILQKPT